LPRPDKSGNDIKYSPSPQPSPSEGRGDQKRNIYPSTYKEQKRGENAKEWKKNLKNFRSSSNSSRIKITP